ncbi:MULTISPECIES: hypothetical protein [Stenotrophomonas]|uniref:hypothetical protein n=1 Tax=Stenotrophomonas TaxID=40323 RepID=UPI0005B6C5EC|nr:hypothetical protein [Stenotrophomonas maltophilia]KIS38476.1 hypothetical protein WJ66_00478 [Stenotrophomonas maltophilia WJ66]MCF3460839.1 hypothetical protein [Stenotrophomonas maltophilia]MCF3517700.1 hypothetical protein [Stenotrophomonas maltophilia]
MSSQNAGEGPIPNFQFQLDGVAASRFADELEKLARSIRQGRIAHVGGGMVIQPSGCTIRIESNLELLVLGEAY